MGGKGEMMTLCSHHPSFFPVSHRRMGFLDFMLEGNMQRQATFVPFWRKKLAAA